MDAYLAYFGKPQDSARQDETLEVTPSLLAEISDKVNASLSDPQLDKEEKKRVKADCSALSKLLMKSKPEKMGEGELSAVRGAMESLRQSAAHLLSMTGTRG